MPLSDLRFVKIRSWHVFSTFTRTGDVLTACGRRVIGADIAILDELPAGKSCKSCARSAIWRAERERQDA